MSKTSKIIVLTVLLLAAIGAAVYVVVFDKKETPSTNNTTNTPAEANGTTTTEQQKTEGTTTPKTEQEVATLTYANEGFSPDEITVSANETIRVVNQSSTVLDFSSDPHPTHTNNPELNVGDIAPGESATFTISKSGTWGFHNHYAPNHHGNVIVK